MVSIPSSDTELLISHQRVDKNRIAYACHPTAWGTDVNLTYRFPQDFAQW